jgi:hypothetical protein
MRVLLISHNHTVQEVVTLALQEMKGVELVMAQAADHVEPTTYDLIFVDDALPSYQESIVLAQTLGVHEIVLLAQGTNTDAQRYPRVIRKPFLPSDIRSEVETKCAEIAQPAPKAKEIHTKKNKKHKKKSHTNVLDLDEITTIKTLLEEEGLKIVGETELAKSVINNEEQNPHDVLLQALRTMRPKKIRKLLKGAKVHIEITFPKDRV